MSGPILFLDSGVGGLSVLAAVRARLPDWPLVYCADSAGFPYGVKSEAEVSARVAGLLGRLTERLRPAIVVIACNTASTIALGHVRPVLAVPVVGTVPAIKPAAEGSISRVIGVLGTDATVRQPYVDDLSARFAADCTVLRHGAADLVLAAEAKLRGETPDPAIFTRAMAGLTSQPGGERMDSIVLACTHFPLVAEELAAASPHPIRLVDGAEGISRRTAHLLSTVSPAAGDGENADNLAIFTAGTAGLAPLLPALKSFGITRVEGL
jgi:glutamate racemase